MTSRKYHWMGTVSKTIVLPVLLVLIWSVLSRFSWIDSRFVPPPQTVVRRLMEEIVRGNLLHDLAASILRNLVGVFAGSVLGLSAGLLLGVSQTAERTVGPLFVFHRQIALFAWVPLLSAWLGGDNVGKCAFITMAAFQPMLMNTWQGVRETPRAYRELARTLTFNQYEFVRYIAVPSAVPFIVTGLRSALIYGWLATIGAELFMNIAPGIGSRMNEGRDRFEMDLLIVCILLLGAFGLFLNTVTRLLQRRSYA